MVHKSVLTEELIANLNLKPGMTVVDGTLGAGGHSIEVLKKILPGGKLISIDWDARAVQEFEHLLKEKGIAVSANKERVKTQSAKGRKSSALVISNAYGEIISPLALMPLFSGDKIVGYWCGANENYANLDKIVESFRIKTVDAIFVDLGFSSDQIEDAKRGFSFQRNGLLDMRYSDKAGMTAADIVNSYSEEDLAKIFKEYGEEKFAARIARGIAEERKLNPIDDVAKLVGTIAKAVPQNYKKGRIHFATRVFQALRIETNQELGNLKIFLDKSSKILASGGRLAAISFHSLEDRIVKKFFQKESRDCICPSNYLKCECDHNARMKIITKKPIMPGISETNRNPRARSAKLRVAEII